MDDAQAGPAEAEDAVSAPRQSWLDVVARAAQRKPRARRQDPSPKPRRVAGGWSCQPTWCVEAAPPVLVARFSSRRFRFRRVMLPSRRYLRRRNRKRPRRPRRRLEEPKSDFDRGQRHYELGLMHNGRARRSVRSKQCRWARHPGNSAKASASQPWLVRRAGRVQLKRCHGDECAEP